MKISLVFVVETAEAAELRPPQPRGQKSETVVDVEVAVAVEKGFFLSWLKTFQYLRFVFHQPLQVSNPHLLMLVHLILRPSLR